VYGLHQGKGYASRALQMLAVLCDEDRMTLSLVARPMGPELSLTPGCPERLSTDQLIAWYTRHGFVDKTAPGDDTRTMVREPYRHDL
jgi:hypothetical protein